ncbi:PREDICTED: LOW QUALITY PROTEIN: pleckstrin homology domain-containing family G member 4B [Elephantulus edwardii]|uniref:LOW QUALITY PROTEIN: pleckstrin homology domain-containing family G member 4B n=1 Tax=Elephantulus edwardii TaxID=28737 RepID=UPI0003F0E029|nr:PREDICTED: LOW QUALITY PROTEIN: pleckstrin homology domain-containing family G member 4B [Elephantulus edwardii]
MERGEPASDSAGDERADAQVGGTVGGVGVGTVARARSGRNGADSVGTMVRAPKWAGKGGQCGDQRADPEVDGMGGQCAGSEVGRTVGKVWGLLRGLEVGAMGREGQCGDQRTIPEDREPFVTYVRSILSELYLPFEATAATVLGQLVNVAEGQRPSEITDFVISARRTLQHLRQAACAQHPTCRALPEGWPLCVHGKVVVQLVALHRVRLRPGDFYLHVAAGGQHLARLVLTCLSQRGRDTEHITVPEAMYGQVFTGGFLEGVSAQRRRAPLQSCLLTTGTAIHRVAWRSITDPPPALQGQPQPGQPPLCHTQEALVAADPHSLILGVPSAPCGSSDGELEGPEAGLGSSGRGSPEAVYPNRSSPCPGGRWFRMSYVEALRNPVPLGCSSEDSLLDKTGDAAAGQLAQGSRPRAAASPGPRDFADHQAPWESHLPTDRVRMVTRRLRSWDKAPKNSRSREPEAQQESGEEDGVPCEGPSGVRTAPPPEDRGQVPSLTRSPSCVPETELRAPSQVLLQSGAVTLPGTRDRGGRAVVQVCMGGPLWTSELTCSAELTCLLMYLHSIPRKEVQDLGLVVLVDTRKGPVTPVLSQALETLQNTVPSIIHSIVLLVDKESAVKPEKGAELQCEVVSSLKALHKLIDSSQLTTELDGSFPYSHSDWICFRRKLESFTSNCKQAIDFLKNAVCCLKTHRTLSTKQEVTEVISTHRAMMKFVLENAPLVTLRLQGGAILARLKKEDLGTTEDGRDAIEAAARLYEHVDEEVHRLVLSSNTCLQWLEGLQARWKAEWPAQVAVWETSHWECRQHLAPEAPSSLLDTGDLRNGCHAATTGQLRSGSQCELQPHHVRWSQGQHASCYLETPRPAATSSPTSQPFPREAQPSGQDNVRTQESMHVSPGVPALKDTLPLLGAPQDHGSLCHPEPTWAPSLHLRKYPLKKIMKKAQNCKKTKYADLREPQQPGHTGVHSRGLEVTNTVAAETPLPPQHHSLSSPSRVYHSEGDRRPHTGSRLHHIMAEMVSTEREYVKSLGYVVENYFPEMERMDLPQDLRGKRGTIFGNLEKLHDFHVQHFLRELERCRLCPLAVGCCFLKHEEQFSMYALYTKNKPRSDALLSSHGNAFFKAKQQALGDKMDLASYLLKPVQRMSKYALLLKDLVKEASRSPAREEELSQLRAAEDMVRFQLRHGNDLLAMDAVRGCDVNLKEQGPLRCQDRFVVCRGRRKYLRQVFLFEDLILFSKTKKVDGGYDVYMYKQSFKTAEIGMTENVGSSGLHFEIWFRRLRRRSQDNYILQASSAEVKATWTSIISRILWRQALRNRELRIQEMVSMGLGNKPFMDIKPSDAAISDRAIDYTVKGAESRSRASIAVSSFDHETTFKRPHSTVSDSSSSSSSSQSSSVLGSLNLHVYPVYPAPPGLPARCPWPYDVKACIKEDELEPEPGSQPSMSNPTINGYIQMGISRRHFLLFRRGGPFTQP